MAFIESKIDDFIKNSIFNQENKNITVQDNEESLIIQKILEKGTFEKALEEIVKKYENCEYLEVSEDIKICKMIVVILKNINPDESTVLKLVQFIANRLSDSRTGFRARGAIIANVCFKTKSFICPIDECYNDFKNICPEFCKYNENVNKGLLFDKFNEVKHINKPQNNTEINFYYHSSKNPMFLQRALQILKEDSDKEAIKTVHIKFEEILKNTSERIFNAVADEVYAQLIDLTHNELLDLQFKSLTLFMQRDFRYFIKSLELFNNTASDVFKAYLLYSFDQLESLLSDQNKLTFHIKFADAIVEHKSKFEASIKDMVIRLVKKGMLLLKELD